VRIEGQYIRQLRWRVSPTSYICGQSGNLAHLGGPVRASPRVFSARLPQHFKRTRMIKEVSPMATLASGNGPSVTLRSLPPEMITEDGRRGGPPASSSRISLANQAFTMFDLSPVLHPNVPARYPRSSRKRSM